MAFGTAPRANGAGYVHLMVRWLPWLDPDTDEPCFAELLSLFLNVPNALLPLTW